MEKCAGLWPVMQMLYVPSLLLHALIAIVIGNEYKLTLVPRFSEGKKNTSLDPIASEILLSFLESRIKQESRVDK